MVAASRRLRPAKDRVGSAVKVSEGLQGRSVVGESRRRFSVNDWRQGARWLFKVLVLIPLVIALLFFIGLLGFLPL